MTNGRSNVLSNVLLGAVCNTFDLHLAIIDLETQFLVFLRVAVLDRSVYCTRKDSKNYIAKQGPNAKTHPQWEQQN